ncbi:MAG: iron-containing alcohol dehydrogenase [Candidatus Helarchaeota archaeon]
MSLNAFRVPLIYHGIGSLKQLRDFREKKVFIVTDKIINELHGKRIQKYLKKKEFLVFDEVEPNPLDETLVRGATLAKEFQPDLIVGIGGGSAMDSAKGIYFLYEREDKSLYDINPLRFFKLGHKSRLLLVPTTSGTGAEHTGAIIITNSKTGQKIGLICYELVPHAIIIDPKLALGMPPRLTASTGIDAVVHAIESLMNGLSSPFTDAMNLSALQLLFEYLPQAVKDGTDIKVREKVHYAASMAGIGLANSAAAVAHSCGHSLGAVFKIQHGVAVGVMLPYVIEFNRKECSSKYMKILESLKITPKKDATKELSMIVCNLMKQIGLPTTLRELDIKREIFEQKLEKLVEFASTDLATSLSPRPASESDIRRIFEHACDGKPIDF